MHMTGIKTLPRNHERWESRKRENRMRQPTVASTSISVPPDSLPVQLQILYSIIQRVRLVILIDETDIQHRRRQPRRHRRGEVEDWSDLRMG